MESVQAQVQSERPEVRDAFVGDHADGRLLSFQVNVHCGMQALHEPKPLRVSQSSQGSIFKVSLSTSRQRTMERWNDLEFTAGAQQSRSIDWDFCQRTTKT